MRLVACMTILGLLGCQSTGSDQGVPIHYDIGVVHREVTTTSPEAQLWFDRGLGLTYGFNHEEAILCFERAAEADPGCAMAHWGKAYALGPNYNDTERTEEASRAAQEAARLALAGIGDCTPAEQALIEALQARYASVDPADRATLDAAYADEMRAVRAAYPDDADVAALCGESLLMLRPWKLWSPEGVPAPETAEIRQVLEAGRCDAPPSRAVESPGRPRHVREHHQSLLDPVVE